MNIAIVESTAVTLACHLWEDLTFCHMLGKSNMSLLIIQMTFYLLYLYLLYLFIFIYKDKKPKVVK